MALATWVPCAYVSNNLTIWEGIFYYKPLAASNDVLLPSSAAALVKCPIGKTTI
jgi:hypothetical protein